MSTTLRLLLVDDSPRFRRTIRAALSGLVSAFEECEDGDQVASRFEAFRPDLVLMDIAMSRKDGIRTTAELLSAHPDARVVIVSAHDGADLRRAAREAGAECFVSKTNLMELRSLLTRPRETP
jgi:DNA-binding NarL/FixJ family response regulator